MVMPRVCKAKSCSSLAQLLGGMLSPALHNPFLQSQKVKQRRKRSLLVSRNAGVLERQSISELFM